MSDFKQTPPLEQPDDGWYLSDAEMDAMTVEELEAAFALALDSMTEETYDGEVISRYLDALDRKDPMPEYPDAETSYARFQEKMNSIYPDGRMTSLVLAPFGLTVAAMKWCKMIMYLRLRASPLGK